MKRPDGVTVVAIYHFVAMIPSLIGACALLIFPIPALLTNPGDEAGLVGGLFGVGIALLATLGFSVLAVIAGVGLLRMKDWARWLAVTLAILQLFVFPIGTIIGALIIWYLLRPDVRQAFAGVPEAPAQE